MKEETVKSHRLPWQFSYLGLSCLIGWNVVLNVSETLKDKDVFTSDFGTHLSTIYGLAMALTILPLIFLPPDVMSRSFRSSIGGSLMFISLSLITASIFFKPASAAYGLVFVSILAVGTALVQGFYFSEAAMHSKSAIGRFSLGQAISGLICLPIKLGLDYILPEAMYSAAAFVAIAAIACAGSIPVYLFSVKVTLMDIEEDEGIDKSEKRSYSAIIADIWPMTLGIFLNFFFLFMVFPNHIPRWNATNKLFDPASYTFLTLAFFVYNVADCLGRYLVRWVTLSRSGVMGATTSRVLTLSLWYMATFFDVSFLTNDFVRLGVLVVHTAIQGLTVTWAFILAPSKITIAAEQPVVGNMNTLALVLGIMTGSALAGPMDRLIYSEFSEGTLKTSSATAESAKGVGRDSTSLIPRRNLVLTPKN